MKRKDASGIWSIIIASTVFLLIPARLPAQAFARDGWTGNLNLFVGGKFLEENEWRPADEQDEWGIEFDFRQKEWPVNITIDYLQADITESEFDPVLGAPVSVGSDTAEFSLGVRKIWDRFPHVRPFFGGGISFVTAESTVAVPGTGVFSDSDEAVGAYIGGGVYWTISDSLNIGFEIRYSSAEVSIGGVEVGAGGQHFGILFGYHW